jgi:methylenetetrahydrofolate dehydrogenase (NADP+)/methenyltetrahydrofolate cyclohydrolase
LSARILSGKEVAAELRSEVAERVAALADRGKSVGLATVLVGDDAASQVYVRNKHRAAQAAGMVSFDRHLPAEASQADVLAQVGELNAADEVDGYIVQLPLPKGLDRQKVLDAIDPAKDADGLHPVNLGKLVLGEPHLLPATPSGILRILDHYGIATEGTPTLIVGRSVLVGRPLAIMLGLKGRDATVTLAHTRTRDLAELTRSADLLVVAAGYPGLIGAEHVKPGATVIDVGTNRVDDRIVGDVDFDAVVEVAGAITPVPGGVGPMTIASLLANTVVAAEARARG